MKNENLINKTIATNDKVVLTYKDTASKDYTVTLLSSPKIQLSELKKELSADVSNNQTTEKVVKTEEPAKSIELAEQNNADTTTAKGKLPQTGVNMAIIFVMLLIALFSIITYKKYNSYKDIK